MHNSKSCIGLILKKHEFNYFFLNYPRNCFKSALPFTTPQSFKRCNIHHVRVSKCLKNDNETVNLQIFCQVPVAGMVENLPSSTAWATRFHYMNQQKSGFFFFIFNISAVSLTSFKDTWWRKAFAHVKYIFITEYVLRLLLKMYQGDGPWWYQALKYWAAPCTPSSWGIKHCFLTFNDLSCYIF